MNLFAAATFAYEGVSRWQLWFDNPNKAAVLFASLALIAWAGVCHFGRVALRRDRLLDDRHGGGRDGARPSRLGLPIIALVIFATCVYALLHTFSRGGMLGLGLGMVVITGFRWRRWVGLLAMALGMLLFPVGRNAVGRLATSAPRADASVGNRLVVWQTVPRMMSDAPGGWGLGNSGNAYMGWYQPLERRENYRTLVGSHFTWLVEFGRAGRFGYLAGWLFVLAATGGWAWRRKQPLPLALWLCLGTAAVFSSVGEAWELWVMPAAALMPVAGRLWRGERAAVERRPYHGWYVLVAVCVVAEVILAAIEWVGRRQTARNPIRVARDVKNGLTVVRRGELDASPDAWVVYDATVMGGPTYGRALRKQMEHLEGNAWVIADTFGSVPQDIRRLTLCGQSASGGPSLMQLFPNLRELRVLSPEKPMEWLGAEIGGKTPTVVCGEFSPNCPEDDHVPGLAVALGLGDYLPDWPLEAFGRLGY